MPWIDGFIRREYWGTVTKASVRKVTADATRGREEPPKQKQSWVAEKKGTLSCISKGLSVLSALIFYPNLQDMDIGTTKQTTLKENLDLAKEGSA